LFCHQQLAPNGIAVTTMDQTSICSNVYYSTCKVKPHSKRWWSRAENGASKAYATFLVLQLPSAVWSAQKDTETGPEPVPTSTNNTL